MTGSWKIEAHGTGWIVTRRRAGRWESLVEHGGMARAAEADSASEAMRAAYVFPSPTSANASAWRFDRAEVLRS